MIYGSFTCTHGTTVTVHESSSAESIACWLRIQGCEHFQKGVDASCHLDKPTARVLVAALENFLKEEE